MAGKAALTEHHDAEQLKHKFGFLLHLKKLFLFMMVYQDKSVP